MEVGVRDNEELARAAARLVDNAGRGAPAARLDGILVQRMEHRLLELMLGYRHDPLVGPMVDAERGRHHGGIAPGREPAAGAGQP